MSFATLLFYAVASFFLGVIANATGGAAALEFMFGARGLEVGGSHEPWQTILLAITIGTPVVFIVLAVYSMFVRAGDAPATAADIRTLIAELQRGSSRDTDIPDPLGPYRQWDS